MGNLISLTFSSMMWIDGVLLVVHLFFDALAFSLAETFYNIFIYMTQLNSSVIGDAFAGVSGTLQNLILVFMLFRLAFEFVKYLINPDELNDARQGGQFFKNIIISITLLVLVMPVGQGGTGFVFGVFNDIQTILIGKIPGTSGSSFKTPYLGIPYDGKNQILSLVFDEDEDINIGRLIAVEVLQNFIYSRNSDGTPITWATKTDTDNGTCELTYLPDEGVFCKITTGEKNFYDLIWLANKTSFFGIVDGAIAYIPIIPLIVGIYLIITFAKFAVDVAVRSLKLIILQILSPIPIIANMFPGNSKMLSKFFTVYLKIFLELILRLFAIYLGVGIIGTVFTLISNGKLFSNIATQDFLTLGILKIMFMIAVFRFMKILPQLINDVFGTDFDTKGKDGFGTFLKGLGGFVLGTGAGLATAGKAGLGGAASLYTGLMGGLGGATAGANAQNFGDYVKGQVGNLSAQKARAQGIAANGGLRGNVSSQFGGPQTYQRQVESVNKGYDYRNNIQQAIDNQFERSKGSRADYIQNLMANGNTREAANNMYDLEKNTFTSGLFSNPSSQSSEIQQTLQTYNSYADSNAVYGVNRITDYNSYLDSPTNLKEAETKARTSTVTPGKQKRATNKRQNP